MARIQGVQEITVAVRMVLNGAKSIGYAGTWGEGRVKNVANAIMVLLDAALQGIAGAGAHKLCRSFNVDVKKACWLIMHRKALEPLGDAGWSLFGGNLLARSERLLSLGWEPTETKKKPLLEMK
ncbi:hypothetical protein MPER_12106 [Moniliophthora perniciosa FA553]|nr:hypothetical protein MPER_12106 [Moniliophthora perniciosa FA553]